MRARAREIGNERGGKRPWARKRSASTAAPWDAALPAAGDVDPVTPIPITPRTRTILIIAAAVILLILLRLAPEVITLALGGAALALFLSLPVGLLTHVMPRAVAIAVVILLLLIAVLIAVLLFVPSLVQNLAAFAEGLPGLTNTAESQMRALLLPLQERGIITAEPDAIINAIEQRATRDAQDLANGAVTNAFSLVSVTIGTFFRLFALFFVAVALLGDIPGYRRLFLRLVPAQYQIDAAVLWDRLGQSLSRYILGLLLSITIEGALVGIALSLLGIPYAFLLGLWTAIAALVPFMGSWLGAIPAMLIALSVSPLHVLFVAVVFVTTNQLESNLLIPRIQGEAVNAPPLLVFLAAIMGAQIGGLAGAVVAVPVVAIVRVLWDFFADRLVVRDPRSPTPLIPAGRDATTAAPVAPVMRRRCVRLRGGRR